MIYITRFSLSSISLVTWTYYSFPYNMLLGLTCDQSILICWWITLLYLTFWSLSFLWKCIDIYSNQRYASILFLMRVYCEYIDNIWKISPYYIVLFNFFSQIWLYNKWYICLFIGIPRPTYHAYAFILDCTPILNITLSHLTR